MTQPIPPDFVAPEIHVAVPPRIDPAHDSALDSAPPGVAAVPASIPAPVAPHASLAVTG